MSIAPALAPAVVPAEISDDTLRAAWARVRRLDWPDTFEEAMADPYHSRQVVLAATHPPRAALHVVRHPWPFMAARALRPSLPVAAAPAFIDLKRAAAGDRDD